MSKPNKRKLEQLESEEVSTVNLSKASLPLKKNAQKKKWTTDEENSLMDAIRVIETYLSPK